MATMEIQKVTQRDTWDIFPEALTMALGIVVQRINVLPADDRQELYELLKEIPNAKDREELDSIVVAMREVLDQRPVRLVPGDQNENMEPRPGLQKWIDYVSAKIRTRRKEADLTQEELAKRSGLPQSHISRLEAGKHSPSRVTLEKLAEALGAKLSEFDPSA